ncbi:MAG: 4Fe-4S binding protein [Anaerolineae bacterium]|nr:4Fe-4S binding protein [Anaerolineae bacterium]MDW8102786.1 4Fe-4S binding protein [Anaerolineae bacterium]
MAKLKGWKELPIGAVVLEPGSSAENKTGTWRSQRPVRDEEKCTHCMICWVYCPDSAVIVKDGKVQGFDYDYCKGCGICAHECPVKVEAHAITGKPGKVIQMVGEV